MKNVVFVLVLGVALSGCTAGVYGGVYEVYGGPVVVVRPHPTVVSYPSHRVVVPQPHVTVRPQCPQGQLRQKMAEEPKANGWGHQTVPARDEYGRPIYECRGQVNYYPDIRYSR